MMKPIYTDSSRTDKCSWHWFDKFAPLDIEIKHLIHNTETKRPVTV